MDKAALGPPKEVHTSAGPIRYRETGEGPAIVFLHGIVANGVLWRRVVPEPPVLRHLQLAGRRPAGLWVIGQSLRYRAIYRLPIAFGRLTVRPIDRDAMAEYTSPLRTNSAVRRDFARLVRAVSSR